MSYKIQIYHPESGFYLNTNHEADDPEQLKELVRSGMFAGVKIRMVNPAGDEIPLGEVPSASKDELTVEDLGRILGVPVLDPKKIFGDHED